MRLFLLAPIVSLILTAAPALADDPQADAARLEKKIAELERQLAELRAEVQDLRQELHSGGKASTVAWGKTQVGLQAGLALRPEDKHSFHVGDTVHFSVKVRNMTDHPIAMPYLVVAPDARVGPSVLDADGKRPQMSGPAYTSVGGRAISKLALATHEEAEFALPELIVGPVGERRVLPKAILQAGPGKYRVSYYVFYLNADETGNYLSTGEVTVEVRQPEEKKE
jgi:hypothetical protein